MRYLSVILTLLLIAVVSFSMFSRPTALPLDDEQHALDEQLTIKVSHVVAEHTPKGQAAQHFAKLVEQKSNGQIIVQVFANAVLYNDEQELEALQQNEVQMIMPTVSKMTKFIPAWALLDLPYLFDDNDTVARYFVSDAAKQLMAQSDAIGVHTAAFWHNGFKQLLSTSPIQSIDDIQEQRVRIMDSYTLQRQFELLGATPVTFGFEEVYETSQQQAYTIQENTFSNIDSKNFYEHQSYITMSNHGILSYAVLFNDTFYRNLPEHARQILQQAIEETTAWHFANSNALNEQAKNDLQQVATFTSLTKEQQQSLRQQWQPLYDAYKNGHYASFLTHVSP
ncbi:MAG: DctP family TRAP transporter solute-binding subunit [Caryophanon sp.]|nr:DctP family TRAP transporter solute-binding subunit [Caryophanon sp.]